MQASTGNEDVHKSWNLDLIKECLLAGSVLNVNKKVSGDELKKHEWQIDCI